MKITIPALTALILGTSPLFAIDLRETQFPAEMPKSITVAGADYWTGDWLKPWVADNPADYAGQYQSQTITDGSAKLEVKVRRAKSTEGDVRWHVDGTLATVVGVGVHHVFSFKNAELMEPNQPCFDVIDRLTSALFVWFTDPDDKEKKPKQAVVIGDQVYVKK